MWLVTAACEMVEVYFAVRLRMRVWCFIEGCHALSALEHAELYAHTRTELHQVMPVLWTRKPVISCISDSIELARNCKRLDVFAVQHVLCTAEVNFVGVATCYKSIDDIQSHRMHRSAVSASNPKPNHNTHRRRLVGCHKNFNADAASRVAWC
jgi:hypothetical protein